MAAFPWVVPHERQGQKLEDFPHLHRWFAAIKERPAVARGLEVGSELRSAQAPMDDTAKAILFGQTARK